MNVLFGTYPMAFHTPGGGEIQLLAYQQHLAAQGVEVTMFDLWNPQFQKHDIFHFFSCVGGSVHLCNFVKQLGMPLVISASLWITETTRHLYPADEIRHQLSLADLVVANSDTECDTLARVLDLPRDKFVTVYNGVDDFFFDPVAPSLFRQHFDLNQPFVLNVGNIEPRKNQLLLVEAMKQFPQHKLVLVGHARNPDYTRQVLEKGGDQVVYLGPLKHDSELLRSAYAACDLFCLPSTLETPGLAALEAAAAGAPLVITAEGSTREYFQETAHYVAPDSSENIAEGIAMSLAKGRYVKNSKLGTPISWSLISQQLVENCYKKIYKKRG